MRWIDTVSEVNGNYHKVIKDVETGEIIVVIDNLNRRYVRDIIESHNDSISKAKEEGAAIAQEIYKELG